MAAGSKVIILLDSSASFSAGFYTENHAFCKAMRPIWPFLKDNVGCPEALINPDEKDMTLIASFLSTSLLLIASNQPHNFTLEDLLKFKCDKGNEKACTELQQIQEDKEDARFLGERVAAFSGELEKRNLMLDEKRPDLAAAYPLVMKDYILGLNSAGKTEELVSQAQLQECARHYHNHWINKKLWWPNDDGKPNWEDIYVFIVDHYYGYCLRKY